jgi:hypothetical protein
MTNSTLKTKTLNIDSKKFHKVRIKMKIIETQYTFFDEKGKETKHTLMRGFVDNEKFTRDVFSKYDISKESMDNIIEVLESVYVMNLEHVGY